MEKAIDSFSSLVAARRIYLKIRLLGLSQKIRVLHGIHERFLQCSDPVFGSTGRDHVKTRDRRGCLDCRCDQFATFIAANEVKRKWHLRGAQANARASFE